MTEPGTSDMCSGTALLMTTLSEGCLQTLLAVTVQTTSVPGMTLPAATSTLLFSPLSLTTSFSTSPLVFSSMQFFSAAGWANDWALKTQAMTAAAPNFP